MKGKNLLLILILFFVFILAFRVTTKIFKTKELQTEKIIPVIVKNPQVGNIEEIVTFVADIKANTEVLVRPRIAGRVQEIFVDEGDFVTKGDPLLSYVEDITKDDELYNDMVVSAPISGIVGIKLVKEGEQVTSQVGGLTNPVFSIYDISQLKANISIPEKYYSFIKVGMPVSFIFDAYPNDKFIGVVNNIRPVIDPLTRTTQIEVLLQNPSNKLRPGMFAKSQITIKQAKNALIIPLDCVLGEDEKYVYVSDGKLAKKIPIVLGIQQGNYVQVVKGLSQSDKVIISGQKVVGDGTKIEEQTK